MTLTQAQTAQTKDVSLLFYSLRGNKSAKQWRICLPFEKYVHVGISVNNMIFNLPTGRSNPKLNWLSSDVSYRVWGKPDESFYLGKTRISWFDILERKHYTNLVYQYVYILSLRTIKLENCVTAVTDYINLFFNTSINAGLPRHLYKEMRTWNYTMYQ